VDYQSDPEQRRSQGSADLIYVRASFYVFDRIHL